MKSHFHHSAGLELLDSDIFVTIGFISTQSNSTNHISVPYKEADRDH